MDNKKNFNIENVILKAEEIDNNTKNNIIRIEPIKVFKFSHKKDINNIIKNVLKNQINIYKNNDAIKHDEKC